MMRVGVEVYNLFDDRLSISANYVETFNTLTKTMKSTLKEVWACVVMTMFITVPFLFVSIYLRSQWGAAASIILIMAMFNAYDKVNTELYRIYSLDVDRLHIVYRSVLELHMDNEDTDVDDFMRDSDSGSTIPDGDRSIQFQGVEMSSVYSDETHVNPTVNLMSDDIDVASLDLNLIGYSYDDPLYQDSWIDNNDDSSVVGYDWGPDYWPPLHYDSDEHDYHEDDGMYWINMDGLLFQGDRVHPEVDLNQKNVRRKHFKDKKSDKNNKDIENAKAALRFLKEVKASKADKHKVIKAIEDTKGKDPKLHGQIMHEVRTKLKFHSEPIDSYANDYIKGRLCRMLGLKESHEFAKYIEGMAFLIANLLQCGTVSHFLTTLLAYISTRIEETMYSRVALYLKDLFADSELTFQSSFIDGLKNISNMLQTGINSGFCTKVFSFMGLLTTISLTSYLELPFNMGSYFKYMALAIQGIVNKGDLFQQLVDHTLYFYEKGVLLFKTKDLSMVFYDIDGANAYQLEYTDLKAYEYLLDAGNLEQIGICCGEYSRRIDEILKKTDAMLKGCKDDRSRAYVGAKKQSLLILKYKLVLAFREMTMRIKPYTLLLHGESGVGKTVVKDLLIQMISKANPSFFSDINSKVSSMNDDDPYMTEVGNDTEWLVLDDAANTQPLYAEKPVTKTVIHASNNEPKAIIKAKVEEKGAHYMNFNGIILTTNKSDLHTKTYTVDPTSVLRRCEVHINVTIKPEHRLNGAYMLDVNKTNGMNMDVWQFTVKRVHKDVESNEPKYVLCQNSNEEDMNCVDLDTLLRFLAEDSRKHFTRQKTLLTDHTRIKNLKMCEHGSLQTVCKHDDCANIVFQGIACVQILAGTTLYFMCSVLARFYHFTNYCLMGMLYFKFLKRYMVKDITARKYFISLYLFCCGAMYSSYIMTGVIGICSVFFGVFTIMPMTITGGLYMFCNKARKDMDDIGMDVWCRANKFYSNNKKLTYTLVAMGSLMSIYHISKIIREVSQTTFQGGIVSSLKHPEPDEKPRTNVYLKPVVQDVKVDPKVKTMTLEQALLVVNRNQAIVETNGIRAGIFPVCQNYWLINRHLLGKNGEGTAKVFRDGVHQLGRNFEAHYSAETWVRVAGGDICLIYLPNGGCQRDLRFLFPQEYTKIGKSCVMAIKNYDGSFQESRFYSQCKMHVYSNDQLDYNINTPGIEYRSPIALREGMCMSVILSSGIAPYILGFHCMGESGGSRGVGNQLTLEDVQGAINQLELDNESLVFQSSSYSTIVRDCAVNDLYIGTHIDRKSAVNFLEKGTCHIYGTMNRPTTNTPSKVKDTMISKDVEELFGRPNEFSGPKYLNKWQPKFEELNAIANTADVNPRILSMAFKDLRCRTFQQLSRIPGWEAKIHPISNEANLAGCDGVYGVNSINLATSTGYPLYTKKSKIIVSDPTLIVEGIARPLVMADEHWAEVDKAEEILATGVRINFIHTASTKDEPKKKDSEKVRVFYVTSLTCLLLCRRYFLMLAKLFMDHSDMFENTIGINVHSKDWCKITQSLLIYGYDRFVNGDFKKYDSRMSVMINLATFKLYIEIAERSGNYTDYQIRVMRGLATEICLPVLNFFLTVMMVYGSTISGHSLTICLNSTDNSLIMRYAFYKIFDNLYENEFHKYVTLFTNGDDNIMSVSPELEGYNHTTIQEALGQDSIIYTMADKDAPSVPFITLEDCSYLKRSFRFSERYKTWICPIEEKSIFKSLHNYIPSKVQSKREHAVEVMNNALREYFYYGEKKFEETRSRLVEIVHRHKLESELPTGSLLTYEAIEEDFLQNQL